MWSSEELEAEAGRVLDVLSGLQGAEVWSVALALVLGPGRAGGHVKAFRRRRPQVSEQQDCVTQAQAGLRTIARTRLQ